MTYGPASGSLTSVVLSCIIFDAAPLGPALDPMLYRQRQRIYDLA